MITNAIRTILHKIFNVSTTLELPPYLYRDLQNGVHYFYILGFKFEFESFLALIFTINLLFIAFLVYKRAQKKFK